MIIDGILIIIAVIIYVKYRDLQREVGRLKQSHLQLSQALTEQKSALQRLMSGELTSEQNHKTEQAAVHPAEQDADFAPLSAKKPPPRQNNNDNASTTPNISTSQTNPGKSNKSAGLSFSLDTFIAKNGLFWLGGLVLALGGVFLATYAIEAGLLPPGVRLTLGGLFGLVLVFVAEFLSRNAQRFNIHTPLLSAAVASGGFITCFAMSYMAFANYQFIGVTAGFILLSIIALLSMLFALKYGALLAVIGMLGAYAVPALVSTGQGNVVALLIYISLISLASVIVANRVEKRWLWVGSFIAHFVWAFGAIFLSDEQDQWLFLMFAIASLYIYVGMAVLGIRLQQTMNEALSLKTLLMPRKEQLGAFFSVLLISVFMLFSGFEWSYVFVTGIIAVILCAAAFRHSALDSWPYIAFALAVLLLFEMPLSNTFEDASELFSSMYLYVQVAVLAGLGFCIFMLRVYPQRVSYLLLMVLVPTAFYGISYVLTPDTTASFVYPYWTLQLLLIAALGLYLAIKATAAIHKLSYVSLANSCITLSCTMLLSASILTLALAVQIALMTILANKYQLSLPKWLFKVAVAAVLFRLTLAPWLPAYADETILSIHFTLVLYPLVFGLFYIAWYKQQDMAIKPWLSGALLHLLALFVTTESSYFISGEYPFGPNMSYSALAIIAMNWLVLAVVYAWRSRLAGGSKIFYQLAAGLLVAGAGLAHVELNLLSSPWIDTVALGEYPVFNLLLALYLVPALLIVTAIVFKLVPQKLIYIANTVAAFALFLFVNGTIRHSFNGEFIQFNGVMPNPMSQAELYTYSIVWLVIASALIVLGKHRVSSRLIKSGFVVLAVVVLKVFLIDSDNLEGLYRALSYIILGLSLVAIGWLFQRLSAKVESTD